MTEIVVLSKRVSDLELRVAQLESTIEKIVDLNSEDGLRDLLHRMGKIYGEITTIKKRLEEAERDILDIYVEINKIKKRIYGKKKRR